MLKSMERLEAHMELVEKIELRLSNYMTNLYQWMLSCLSPTLRTAVVALIKPLQDLLSISILSYNMQRVENLRRKLHQHQERIKEVDHAKRSNLIIPYQMVVNPFGELLNEVGVKSYHVDGIVSEYCTYFEEMPIELLFTFEYLE